MAARLTSKCLGCVPAQITDNFSVAPGFMQMDLSLPGSDAFCPGQFFQIEIPDGGIFLRRPFAPSVIRPHGIGFVYAVVGRATEIMATLQPGTRVDVVGPLGHGWTVPPSISHAFLVGGGCGSPSLLTLATLLIDKGVRLTVVVGARNSSSLLSVDEFLRVGATVLVATDDGSKGIHGTVVNALETYEQKADMIYACGPLPMLRAVALYAQKARIMTEVSLEQRMACGIGACVGCVVPLHKTDDNSQTAIESDFIYKKVCTDGPVFNAARIDWQNL